MSSAKVFASIEQDELWRIREHFVKKVERELELIGQRMTWLVTSQAFLFAAWIQAKTPDARSLALVVSCIGFAIAVPAIFSICAALRVLKRTGGYYMQAVEIALGLPPMGTQRQDPITIHFGNWPAIFLPSIFAGTWVAVGVNTLFPGILTYRELGGVPLDVFAIFLFVVVAGASIGIGYFWSWTTGPSRDRTRLSAVLQKALAFAESELARPGDQDPESSPPDEPPPLEPANEPSSPPPATPPAAQPTHRSVPPLISRVPAMPTSSAPIDGEPTKAEPASILPATAISTAPAASRSHVAKQVPTWPDALKIGFGVVVVLTFAYLLIHYSHDATQAIARWVSVPIFVGYAALMLTLFASVVLGALKKDFRGPVMALVRNEDGTGVSLSRLQALLWTAIITFAWLYRLMLDPAEFPTVPTQALVLMGISGATYLGAKSMTQRTKQVEATAAAGAQSSAPSDETG